MKAQLLRVDGWRGEVLAEIFDCAHGLERARHHLGGSRAARGIGHFRFEQFSMGEDDAQLVVEAVEQEAELWCISHVASRSGRCRTRIRLGLIALFLVPHRFSCGTIGVVRIAPQRIDEDADGSACGAHVFDLA